MKHKKIFAALLAVILCIGMAAPAYAATNPFAYMEAQSRKAVEVAIKAGTVPAGTTIYDCAYGADKSGATIVIQYRDKNGNWIDISAQKKMDNQPAANATTPSSDSTVPVGSVNQPEQKQYIAGTTIEKLSAETLAEYAAEAIKLTNAEREKAGLALLEHSSILTEAAMIRAAEVIIVDRAGGQAHTRPDGTSYKDLVTDMGLSGRRCGENIARSEATPQFAITAWMNSDGHRKNILREDYGSIGIGVYQLPNGTLDWVQIFMLK